ncbi:outer membrane protein assembly factor BamE [Ramlibacter sp. WS9]|uniref:outer membrane protein assembly factor BamE n=1 Tax=Ramlibacter sp. WS9 TaxID=1882741 RepID=UPI0011426D27|nr:outer membrane protein assembly factor BamE [Ramlibacter sp. WS9]ROZ64888.1 outer membrane protein assembly factor BamE [Ramlibacter sp. WS9]
MPAFPPRATRLALALSAGAFAAGCGSFDNASQRLAGIVTPYKVEVVQGNFVSKEQAEAVKPGMTRQQVRDILGTPLVTSIFHNERWDYVFTLKRQGVPAQERKLAVHFKGGVMERAEGDEMPSEAEFVATLGSKHKNAKVPPLEASEDKLQQFNAGRPAAAPAPAPAPAEPPPATSYPPLEAPTR